MLASVVKQSAPTLIGLIGPRRSGKSTVARHLVDAHGYAEAAFADSMRMLLLHADPQWEADLRARSYEVAKDEVPGFRERMVDIGEAARRWVHPDIWVFAVDRKVDGWSRLNVPVVVSDVRRANEVAWLHSRGGVLVSVNRSGREHEHCFTESASLLAGADYHLTNPGDDMAELHERVRWMLDALTPGRPTHEEQQAQAG